MRCPWPAEFCGLRLAVRLAACYRKVCRNSGSAAESRHHQRVSADRRRPVEEPVVLANLEGELAMQADLNRLRRRVVAREHQSHDAVGRPSVSVQPKYGAPTAGRREELE